jgi:hypothetical protein
MPFSARVGAACRKSAAVWICRDFRASSAKIRETRLWLTASRAQAKVFGPHSWFETMSLDLTIALCLRDDETRLPVMAKAAVEVAEALIREHAAREWHEATSQPQLAQLDHPQTREEAWIVAGGDLDLSYEVLALDESSRDNTLSVLSILHGRHAQLRSFQALARGSAVMRGARLARGRVWLFVDAPFDPQHGLWAARQVFCGDQAAVVPGEVLALRRGIGQAALGWHEGGLVSAQREVEHLLDSHGQRPAWSPARNQALRSRARLFLRGRLSQIGLGQFDRS